jgi:glycosyltransferase involved in cell wall biosynthesis
MMKVMFLFQGLPHYYNYVLNRLNDVEGLEIVNVIPHQAESLPMDVYQTDDGINFRVCRLFEYSFFGGGMFFRGFWKLLQKERPDVLVVTDAHIRGVRYDFRTFLARKWFGIPVILKTIPFRMVTYGDAVRHVKERFYRNATKSLLSLPLLSLSTVRRLYRIWAYRSLCRFPNAHVNYVEAAYELYGSYGVSQKRIFVTYNSPDTDRLLSVHKRLLDGGVLGDAHPHRIIHVGRLAEWKRVDLLLLAVSRLKPKFPDLDLLVIGYGPMEEPWKKLAVDLKIDKSVQFVGGVYDPIELGRYMMTSTVYVLAGMGGLSINEAMCFGMPIICSICDGTEKNLVIDGYNGYFFRDGDVDDLCLKIERVLLNPASRLEMGLHSLELIKNIININTVINGYISAFNFVTGQNISNTHHDSAKSVISCPN